jgi:hypothetical protein
MKGITRQTYFAYHDSDKCCPEKIWNALPDCIEVDKLMDILHYVDNRYEGYGLMVDDIKQKIKEAQGG